METATGEGMSALSWKKKVTSITAYNQSKLRKVKCFDM